MTQRRASHTRLQCAKQKRAQPTKQRRLQQERERLRREPVRAQRTLQALEAAIADVALPETVAAEVACRLKAQGRLLSKSVGLLFPPGVWLSPLP
jgi:hypothetical protein